MRIVCRVVPLLAALPLLMGAAMYRWVDADGVVNFTQRQPAGIAAQRMTAEPAPLPTAQPPPAAEPASAVPDTAADPNHAGDTGEQAPADPRKVAQLLRADCEAARGLLQQLTSRGRVRSRGADGVEQVLPEDERQARIRDTERAIATYCQGTASR